MLRYEQHWADSSGRCEGGAWDRTAVRLATSRDVMSLYEETRAEPPGYRLQRAAIWFIVVVDDFSFALFCLVLFLFFICISDLETLQAQQ